MTKVDKDNQNSDTNNKYVFIHHEEGQYLKIDKKDLKPSNDTNHQHAYKPDYSDETEDYIAFICVRDNCHTGRLVRKDDSLKKLLDRLKVS